MKNLILSGILVFCATLQSFSQTAITAPVCKLGKATAADFEPSAFEKDTSAHAVILYDYGSYEFIFNVDNGFEVRYYFHQRIKILDKQGMVLANKIIPYQSGQGSEEDVYSIEGYTYNLVNGEVKKDHLAKKSVVDEKKVNGLYLRKIAMPNVQVGSIIEIEYFKTSPQTFSLPDWYFQQTDYPVLWSEVETTVPRYWEYAKLLQGYEPLVINKETDESFPAPFLSGYNGTEAKYTAYHNHFAMQNVPALRETDHTNTLKNYLARINFDMVSFKSPFQMARKNFATTWEKVAATIMDDEQIGEQLDKGFMADALKELTLKDVYPAQRTEKILAWVKKSVKWDGDYSIAPNDGAIKKAFDAKKGNSADMNLLLIAALRKAGVEAYPVFISTKKNGYIFRSAPNLNYFNHVIVNAVYDGQPHLIDASTKAAFINQLTPACFNGDGFCVKDKKTFEWIPLTSDKTASKKHRYEVKLNTDGSLEGTYKARFTDTEALLFREEFAEKTNDDIKKEWEKTHKGMTIKTLKIMNMDSLAKAISIEAEIKVEGKAQVADKIIYINPLIYDIITENPLKTETRKTPIHFDYLSQNEVSVRIDLPEGYTIEELPKPSSIALQNSDAKATIVYGNKPNQLEISSKISINKTMFLPTLYPVLREWYSTIIAKQSEQVVIKTK